jgi:hypothetical protein
MEIVDTINQSTSKAIARADGTMTIEWRRWVDGTKGTDQATWYIQGDTFCEKWTYSFDGQEKCFRYYQNGLTAFNKWTTDGDFHVFMWPAGG